MLFVPNFAKNICNGFNATERTSFLTKIIKREDSVINADGVKLLCILSDDALIF